jgi:hypothetical protein
MLEPPFDADDEEAAAPPILGIADLKFTTAILFCF